MNRRVSDRIEDYVFLVRIEHREVRQMISLVQYESINAEEWRRDLDIVERIPRPCPLWTDCELRGCWIRVNGEWNGRRGDQGRIGGTPQMIGGDDNPNACRDRRLIQ